MVLAWYPKAYTSGCTIECKSLAEHGNLIRQFDTVYFMASVDPIDKNKGFAAEQKADFPLLSDPTKETAKAYGVLNAMGIASRVTFVIGADGKISRSIATSIRQRPRRTSPSTLARLDIPKKS